MGGFVVSHVYKVCVRSFVGLFRRPVSLCSWYDWIFDCVT